MSKITHYAKLKPKAGVNYYIDSYHITAERFTGIDEQTASYLRKQNAFEVITKKQYNKQNGIEEKEEEKEVEKEEEEKE